MSCHSNVRKFAYHFWASYQEPDFYYVGDDNRAGSPGEFVIIVDWWRHNNQTDEESDLHVPVISEGKELLVEGRQMNHNLLLVEGESDQHKRCFETGHTEKTCHETPPGLGVDPSTLSANRKKKVVASLSGSKSVKKPMRFNLSVSSDPRPTIRSAAAKMCNQDVSS